MNKNSDQVRNPAYALAIPPQSELTYSAPVHVALLPRRIALAIACSVAAVSVAVLLGWIFDIEAAKNIFPNQAKMAPATALGLLSAAAALIGLCPRPAIHSKDGSRLFAARALALFVASIGALKWGDYLFGMTASTLDHKVVSTIISLAHSFGFPVIAEGVETVEQAKALHELGCDEAQGFLFSQPLPPSEIVGLFESVGDQ